MTSPVPMPQMLWRDTGQWMATQRASAELGQGRGPPPKEARLGSYSWGILGCLEATA